MKAGRSSFNLLGRNDSILECHEIININFTYGDNCYLYTEDGERYVDFESGIWCSILGHSHSRLGNIIRSQADKLIHLGLRYPSLISKKAASKLLDITNMNNGKCVFLSSGSEAVEFSIQATRKINNKPLLLTLSNSYLGAYGMAGRRSDDLWVNLDLFQDNGLAIHSALSKVPFSDVGGFVFEPGGSGSSFVNFPSKKLIEQIAHTTQECGGLLIANEVTTGIGRTGRWFGYQHYNIKPDIVALGKGLGNGYPVSAIAMTQSVSDCLQDSGFHYVQSHQNDPLGCAIAKEVLEIVDEEYLIDRANNIGKYFLNMLEQLKEKHKFINDIRGRGLLLAIEFEEHNTVTVEWAYLELLKHKFLVGYYSTGRILRFDPALTVEKKDIDQLIECLDSILTHAF